MILIKISQVESVEVRDGVEQSNIYVVKYLTSTTGVMFGLHHLMDANDLEPMSLTSQENMFDMFSFHDLAIGEESDVVLRNFMREIKLRYVDECLITQS